MDFRILGPLEARSGGLSLRLGGPRQCALLAYLLLHANEFVSADRLLDEVWPELPEGGAAAVQTQVSRLKRVVGDDRLLRSSAGYALRVEPGELDLDRLRALLADAGAAPTPEERSRLLREAEELWDGEPLAGIEAPFVEAEAAALDELRYGALEDRIAADLDRGLAAELLPELALLVARRPLRERLRMHQMLALYRAGRQADALETSREARAALDEIGLEPTSALRQREREILLQDPALDLPERVEAAESPARRRRRAALAGSLLGLVAVAGVGSALLAMHSSGGGGGPTPRAARREMTTATVVESQTTYVPVVAHRRHVRQHVAKRSAPRVSVVARATVATPPTTTASHKRATKKARPPKAATTQAAVTVTTAAAPPRKPATISDSFTGTQIDGTIWYQIAAGTGWTLTQHDGYVEYSFGSGAVPGGQYTQMGGHLGTQCKFPGDFDARVDFALVQWPPRSGVVVNLWAFFSNAGYAVWRQSSTQWGELIGSFTGPNTSGGVQLDDATGSLRLVRHDGLMTAFFMHKGAWDALTSSPEAGMATIAIGANAGADFAGQPVVVDLRNFTVTGDDPSCPPGSQPPTP